MRRGFFITFEGGEGCGKSTHIRLLSEYFAGMGRECVVTREPGGTPLSEKIRELLLDAREGAGMSARTEILLFEAARAEHVDKLIRPSLDAGKIVICDRFYDSTSAYQGAARAIDSESVDFLNSFAAGSRCARLDRGFGHRPPRGARPRAFEGRRGARQNGVGEARILPKGARGFSMPRPPPSRTRFAVVDSSGDKAETFEKILRAVEGRLP